MLFEGFTPEFICDETAGLYLVFVVAGVCHASTQTCGGNTSKRWCAQSDPGGRPSIGPVPPPRIAGTDCCVVFASAVGAGPSDPTELRLRTSNRSMGCVNACT